MFKKISTLLLTGLLAVTTLSGCMIYDLGDTLAKDLADAPNQVQPAKAPAVQDSYATTVIRVIDGDTIAVTPTADLLATNEKKTEHAVRLLGIDTPEMNYTSGTPECGAPEATAHLEKILPAQAAVTISYDPLSAHSDRFGRSLAYVGYENAAVPYTKDAGSAQVLLGYAKAWYPTAEPEPSNFSMYQQLSQNAQDEQLGMWNLCDSIGR